MSCEENHDWIDEIAEAGWRLLFDWTLKAFGVKVALLLLALLTIPFFLRNP